jgi:guanylate kinase
VRAHLAAGDDIVLEIDWQGAAQVRSRLADAIGIFLLPPTFAMLEQRLRARAQDSDAVISRRLDAARAEIAHAPEFDYVIFNDVFDDAVRDLCAIVRAARLRTVVRLAANPRLLNF